MKSPVSVVLLILSAALGSYVPALGHAGEGSGHSGGGGDEIYFHSLASQIDQWLTQYRDDGSLTPKLELAQLSANELVSAYKTALRNTPDVKFIPQDKLKASCDAGDSGACLLLENPSRVCVNHRASSVRADRANYIRCNANLFNGAGGDLQFAIVFHEYLGVAGIEINGSSSIQSYSQYPISKYLLQFAAPKTVIRYELGGQKATQGTATKRACGQQPLVSLNRAQVRALNLRLIDTIMIPCNGGKLLRDLSNRHVGCSLYGFADYRDDITVLPKNLSVKRGGYWSNDVATIEFANSSLSELECFGRVSDFTVADFADAIKGTFEIDYDPKCGARVE